MLYPQNGIRFTVILELGFVKYAGRIWFGIFLPLRKRRTRLGRLGKGCLKLGSKSFGFVSGFARKPSVEVIYQKLPWSVSETDSGGFGVGPSVSQTQVGNRGEKTIGSF